MFRSTDIAVGLYILGQIFRTQGRIREACRYLAIACGYLELNRDLSMLFNVAMCDTENRKEELRKKRASKGGFGRGRKFEPVCQKVIELLEKTKRPELVWEKKEHAFKAIDENLWQFIEEKGIVLEHSELRSCVFRWSREREDVREVFERVVA
ncbi:hypothetical protein ID854_15915 [Xenorhabdus sp. M]|uniref:Transcriptional regulator n=1 Tax=Xenorhabdus szentirmaii TaxID=290112 RepID=A0AAW3YWH6_9GAMM|nr:hypothetical protein [Xenorhabdus sp. M]MBD2801881.1 hypothetical protein [Xenorhabdus sp. M]